MIPRTGPGGEIISGLDLTRVRQVEEEKGHQAKTGAQA